MPHAASGLVCDPFKAPNDQLVLSMTCLHRPVIHNRTRYTNTNISSVTCIRRLDEWRAQDQPSAQSRSSTGEYANSLITACSYKLQPTWSYLVAPRSPHTDPVWHGALSSRHNEIKHVNLGTTQGTSGALYWERAGLSCWKFGRKFFICFWVLLRSCISVIWSLSCLSRNILFVVSLFLSHSKAAFSNHSFVLWYVCASICVCL